MNVRFTYMASSGEHGGKFLVDDNSSLCGLSDGEQFTVQYNPANPSSYYSDEAFSLSQTIRRTVAVVLTLFAVFLFLIEFLGR